MKITTREQNKKRKKSRTSLPGEEYGVVFTSKEVTDHLEQLAREKIEKETRQKERSEVCQSVKAKKAALEERWKEIQDTYKTELEDYNIKKE